MWLKIDGRRGKIITSGSDGPVMLSQIMAYVTSYRACEVALTINDRTLELVGGDPLRMREQIARFILDELLLRKIYEGQLTCCDPSK